MDHAPSGMQVGDKRSNSISFSGNGHVEYLYGKDCIMSSNLKISGFDPAHDSKFFAYSKLSTLKSRLKKMRIHMLDSLDMCGQKANLQRKSWGFKNTWISMDAA